VEGKARLERLDAIGESPPVSVAVLASEGLANE
jgi:hypothetical protein